jgi:hypothetical protein
MLPLLLCEARRRLLSDGLSLAEVPQLASLYVPLSAASHAAVTAGTAAAAAQFQAAAVLAAAIDTLTLPLRCTGDCRIDAQASTLWP